MYKIAKLKKEDRKILFENASFKLKYAPIVIEKDFWITLILDYLFNKSQYKELFAFKGGTCLSKCYKITKRFSEDIDIVLDWSAIGYTTEYAMQQRSSKKREGFVLETREKTSIFLKNYLIPDLKNGLKELLGYDLNIYLFNEDIKTIIIEYPNLFDDNAILPNIKLEIGCLSAIKPTNIIEISSYLYEYYPQFFNYGRTKVKTVTPESIFWEKVLILYQNSKKELISPRQSRHYYDLASFIGTKYETNALKDLSLLKQAINITRTFYYSSIYKDPNICPNQITLIPNGNVMLILKNDYKTMEEMLIEEKNPTFDEIITKVELINKKLKFL